jgi:hypothetical protein
MREDPGTEEGEEEKESDEEEESDEEKESDEEEEADEERYVTPFRKTKAGANSGEGDQSPRR